MTIRCPSCTLALSVGRLPRHQSGRNGSNDTASRGLALSITTFSLASCTRAGTAAYTRFYSTLSSTRPIGTAASDALVHRLTQEVAESGCQWLHVDYEPQLAVFYEQVCGFRTTHAGLIQLTPPAGARSDRHTGARTS
jgi:hypothetical protein